MQADSKKPPHSTIWRTDIIYILLLPPRTPFIFKNIKQWCLGNKSMFFLRPKWNSSVYSVIEILCYISKYLYGQSSWYRDNSGNLSPIHVSHQNYSAGCISCSLFRWDGKYITQNLRCEWKACWHNQVI